MSNSAANKAIYDLFLNKNPPFFNTTSSVNKLMTKDKLAWRSGERDQFQVIIINPSVT